MPSLIAACCRASSEACRPFSVCWRLRAASCSTSACFSSERNSSIAWLLSCRWLSTAAWLNSAWLNNAWILAISSSAGLAWKLFASAESVSVLSDKRRISCSRCWIRDCWTSACCRGSADLWLNSSHCVCQLCIASSASWSALEDSSSAFTASSKAGSSSTNSAFHPAIFCWSALRCCSVSV